MCNLDLCQTVISIGGRGCKGAGLVGRPKDGGGAIKNEDAIGLWVMAVPLLYREMRMYFLVFYSRWNFFWELLAGGLFGVVCRFGG